MNCRNFLPVRSPGGLGFSKPKIDEYDPDNIKLSHRMVMMRGLLWRATEEVV